MKTIVPAQPALDPRMLVPGIVIADDVNLLVLLDSLIDQAQKLQPLMMTMPLLAQPIDLPGSSIESGKQGCSAIALVIVRHGLTATFLHRQAGLSAVQGLDLALFIDR